jgi:GMP synthase (glutamine-hydrolysing)
MDVLAVIHGDKVRAGVFGDVVAARGHRLEEWSLAWDTPLPRPLDAYGAVLVFGGAMHADQDRHHPWLREENLFLQRLLDLRTPVLGICLGAQLLAAALGARVRPNRVREIGWYRLQPALQAKEDRLFRHFDGSQHVFQWHAYTFDLPPGGLHLASTESCEHQAFRFGERAYGLQFHLEADEALIQRWLAVPAYRAELEAEAGAESVARVLRDTHGHVAPALKLSERVFHEFIELFEWRPALRLASR